MRNGNQVTAMFLGTRSEHAGVLLEQFFAFNTRVLYSLLHGLHQCLLANMLQVWFTLYYSVLYSVSIGNPDLLNSSHSDSCLHSDVETGTAHPSNFKN